MEIRNELRYRLAVALWEQMAADGLLTKEELARAKQLSAERYLPRTVWEYDLDHLHSYPQGTGKDGNPHG